MYNLLFILLCIMLFMAFVMVVILVLQFRNIFDSVSQLELLCGNLFSLHDVWNDEMLILAETLQTYHELLNDYQIPMIACPHKKQMEVFENDW